MVGHLVWSGSYAFTVLLELLRCRGSVVRRQECIVRPAGYQKSQLGFSSDLGSEMVALSLYSDEFKQQAALF